MRVSNVTSGVLVYLSPSELEHMGGLGTRVSLRMKPDRWILSVDEQGSNTLTKERDGKGDYPSRATFRKRPKNLPYFGATSWETSMAEGPSLVALVSKRNNPPQRPIRLKNGEFEATGPEIIEQRLPKPRARLLDPAPTTTTEPTLSLANAIEEVNRHKDRLGLELALSVDSQGYLEAHSHYGRR